MDMRQMRQFLAVVEHGNMMRAADALHLSQPALSKSIHNLESELGIPLLRRHPRGVSPTIYGDILLKHAKLLRNQSEKAVLEIRNLKDGHAGHLRLGVANFAVSFLPRVIVRLLDAKPGLSLEVVDGTYEELTAAVREGFLDALVAGFPPLHRAEDLVHEPLVPGEFLLICSPDHPLGRRKRVSLDDIATQRWILANRPQAIVDMVELTFRNAGVAPPKPMVHCRSMLFLKSILLEGQFVTLLPRGVVWHELAAGQLVAVPVGEMTFQTREGIIYRADAIHPPALFALIEALKTETSASATIRQATSVSPTVPRTTPRARARATKRARRRR
jgi:DNA-binding transcriptional LysR family regulator